jgi:hypothetical protein
VAAVPEQCSSAAARSIQPGSGGSRITRKVRTGACHWLGELASSLSDLFRQGCVSGFLRLVGSCLLVVYSRQTGLGGCRAGGLLCSGR